MVPAGSLLGTKQVHQLSEIERESLHVNHHYGQDIDDYQRDLEIEPAFNTS